MANGNIRGITIELNGDTTGLDNALRDVNRQSKNLQGELKEVEKALKLDPSNVELVRQKQQLLTQSIQSTSDKLNTLRQAQGQVEAQFRRGEIGEEQYRAFRRELVNAENSMRSFEGQLDSLQTEQQRLADTTRSLGAFFNATGTDVDQFSGTLGTRLTQAIRNGTASADQMERALRLMGRQALGASTDIDEMRRALNQINNGGSIDSIRFELQQMNQVVVTAQDELKEIDKLLKFNPNSTELLTQKQAVLSRSIQETSSELLQLQQRQSQVETQFRSGQMGEEQYRAFRREIEQTEQSLRGYQNELRNMEQEQQDVRSSARQLETLFNATGMSARDFADVLGNDLTRAITEGRATSAQFEQALDRVGRSALGSRADLTQMRDALRNIDNGANLDQIRADLDRIANSANQAENDVNGFGDSLSNVAGALVAGGGISKVVEEALDLSSLEAKIDVTFAVPEESKKFILSAVREIAAYGIDAEEALEAVRRQWALNADATDEANQKIVEGAGAIARAFQGIDLIELVQEVNEIAAALGVTDDEALALTNSLLKAGFPPEQLDIIAEYGTQLKMAGYNAQEIQAIMASASSQNSWNIDNLLDGLKEGRIKLTEFGDSWSDALSELIEGTNISADMLDSWGKAVAKGGEEGSKAMRDAAQAVSEIEDPTKKALIMVEMFGTMAEDQGNTIANTLIEMGQHMTTTAENQKELNETVAGINADPMIQLQKAIANVKTALAPLLSLVADLISSVSKWMAENPKLTATIVAITTALGILFGIILALAPIVTAVATSVGLLGVSFGAIAGPIGIAVAAIAGLVAAGVALYLNWETVSSSATSAFGSIKDTISTTVDTLKQTFSDLSNSIGETFGPIIDNAVLAFKNLGSSIMEVLNGDFTQLGELFSTLLPTLIGLMIGGIPGLIISASRFLPAIAEGIESNKGVLIETINNVVNSIVQFLEVGLPQLVNSGLTIVLNLVNGIVGALPTIITAGVSLIQTLLQGIASALPTIVSAALEVVTSLVTGIANALPGVIDAGIQILNAVIDGLTSVLPLLIAAALMLITSIVTTLVQNLPKILQAGVEILMALVNGIVKILPTLISTAIKLIVTIVTTLAQNLPKIIQAGIQVLEALIDGIIKILPTLIKTAIDLVIKIAGAIIENLPTILKAGKDILLALIEGIISIVGTLLSSIGKNIVTPLINKFKEIDLKKIGKDIINGLIVGIGEKFAGVRTKIEELASNIPAWAKKILGIKSPSRVMKQIGLWTGEGLAIGIEESETVVSKAMESIYNSIISTSNEYATEQKKLQEELNKSIASSNEKSLEKIYKIQNKALKEKRSLTKAENAEISKLQKEHLDQKVKLEQTYNDKIKKMRKDSDKDYLGAIESFINDKKSLEQLSIVDEAAIWEKSIELFVEGTDERIKAQQNYKKAVETVNKEIVSINENYQKQMQTINDNLVKDIQAANDAYEKAYSSRVDAIRNFKGLFDEFVVSTEKSGQDLLNNLQSQVTGLESWKETIASLGERISDESLIQELQALGPNAVGELQALNSLSDKQLQQYVALYNEKFTLAREQASTELSGMKEDTVLRIEEMKVAANEELEALQIEWNKAIMKVTKATDNELASLYRIGKDAGQGLYDGLASMEPSLIAKARAIADAIRSTIQRALDIHSPSRVMKGFGINIGEGLIIGMDEMISKVAQSSARLSNAVVNAQASLANSAQKSMQYGSSNTASSTSIDNRKTFAPVVHINTANSGDRAMERTLRRLAFQFN